MLIVLLIIFVALVVVDLATDFSDETIAILSSILAIVCIGGIVVVACLLVSLKPIDAKIQMYEEENAHIEQQISEAISAYQEHEKGVFESVSTESAITLVSLYPELKSDALVERQIEAYVDNNNSIRKLKSDKLNEHIYRWWLYFGKPKG